MQGRQRLVAVALAGGLGGLLNAALCYVGWPVHVASDFEWHLMPAGFLHGSVLAVVAVAAGIIGNGVRASLRWAIALAAGWLAGYVSWIPLDISLSLSEPPIRSFVWPFTDSDASSILAPFSNFGGVTVIVCTWTLYFSSRERLGRSILAASAAGVVGSWWFWTDDHRWYLSFLHGIIWGSLVGTALWRHAPGGVRLAGLPSRQVGPPHGPFIARLRNHRICPL